MATPSSAASTRINEYLNNAPGVVRSIGQSLRRIIFKAEPEMTEDWKWGPNYSKNGMVCGIGLFKKHATLAFFQGARMKDPKHLFQNDVAPARNTRSIKFTDLHDLDEPALVAYIKEAVTLNLNAVPAPERTLDIPEDVDRLLRNHPPLKRYFDALSYTHRKEYVRWIASAKKDETRKARLGKMVEMLRGKLKHP
ncbi:MAG TPA: YdeI/OmpD-associated family protein [Bacteroidota bacterium]|nr:YdeI/OmpD-associated family protein [Bacteroidota bacterium]